MLPPAGAHAAHVETSFRLVNGRLLAVTRVRGRSPAPMVSPVSTPSPPPPPLCLDADGNDGPAAAVSGGAGLPLSLTAVGGGAGADGRVGIGTNSPAVMPFRPLAPGAGGTGSPPVVAQPLPPQAAPTLEMMGMVVSSEEEGLVMGDGDDDLFSLHFDGEF